MAGLKEIERREPHGSDKLIEKPAAPGATELDMDKLMQNNHV